MALVSVLRKGFGLHLKELIGETFTEWNNDNAQRLGASLAFYTLLSLAPLVVVVVAVGAMVFGKDAAEGQFAWQIRNFVGPLGAQAIQEMIRGAYKPQAGVVATALSLITLIFGATSVAVELRDALNIIWHVPGKAGTLSSRIGAMVKERFLSLVLVLGAGLILVVSLIWSAWIAAMGRYFGSVLPLPESVLHLATFVVTFLAISTVFAAIYKFVPDVTLQWGDVIVGACFSALVFTIGKQLLDPVSWLITDRDRARLPGLIMQVTRCLPILRDRKEKIVASHPVRQNSGGNFALLLKDDVQEGVSINRQRDRLWHSRVVQELRIF